MKELITNKGNKVLVDDFNYERLKHLKLNDFGTGIHIACYNSIIKKCFLIPLAKIILLTDAPIVDHKDRNYLNFQVNNLRPCSRAENNFNKSKCINIKSSSKYKGVHKRRYSNSVVKWRAKITANGKEVYLGQFKTELEAVNAYNEAVDKYHGKYGVKNVI